MTSESDDVDDYSPDEANLIHQLQMVFQCKPGEEPNLNEVGTNIVAN